MLILVTVYHDACIENLLLRLILFTFRIKLKAPLRQMSDFTLSPSYLDSNFYVMPATSSFSAPSPDNYCTVSHINRAICFEYSCIDGILLASAKKGKLHLPMRAVVTAVPWSLPVFAKSAYLPIHLPTNVYSRNFE